MLFRYFAKAFAPVPCAYRGCRERDSTKMPRPTPSTAMPAMYCIGASGLFFIARLSSTGVNPPAMA